MNISKDKSLLQLHLESIEAGGPELIDGDTYEMVGDNNTTWDVSISILCGTALRRIQGLEYRLSRYSMDAGQADQRKVESDAMREVLGFRKDADDVSASDLLQALARLKAECWKDAYLAGWEASGEGWNGEYPDDADKRDSWIEERDEWIRRQAKEGE